MNEETFNFGSSRAIINMFEENTGTYDHRVWKIGLPVRSAVLKPHAESKVSGKWQENGRKMAGTWQEHGRNMAGTWQESVGKLLTSLNPEAPIAAIYCLLAYAMGQSAVIEWMVINELLVLENWRCEIGLID
ncbi:hypothetical protein M752DRAFT_264309 [Aspergillus phoenicis ATCC 13157]|uniref:Uncharacterized protein n=1 Tax=Aspergillus phoenicis ATCC 13157 TaxID=1353007 RepID=A0A370PQD3_ASPPH|nr:hypothetical protein M752DRAFT_264309 [Aspergillus phoenicis ATCC 13157]